MYAEGKLMLLSEKARMAAYRPHKQQEGLPRSLFQTHCDV